MDQTGRAVRWWTLGGVVVACAGAALIAHNAIEARRAAFETDARIVHRLLSQQAVQHEAILDTLALLQPMAGTADPRPPELRLPALCAVGQLGGTADAAQLVGGDPALVRHQRHQ